ncbi:MAG: xanthine dehydrogenase family protein molybdopterin-binding subunit, partial [Myxococcales bacterium]
MSEAWTGKGIDRVDGRLKVTGKATYAAEVAVANAAHAVIVGSTVGRGRVTSIDAAAAEKAPGVLAVLTHLNAPRLPGAKTRSSPVSRTLQLLQDDEVHYSDQPVALVVADTLERARLAAALVVVRYESSTPVTDPLAVEGQAYAPAKMNDKGADLTRGDVDRALATAKARVLQTYTTPIEHHHPMEMHATTAVWQGDDRLTVYDSTQGVFEVRRRLAEVFGLPKEQVRVLSPYIGGGFGSKGSAWSHVALAALAARVVRRGVRLMVSRPHMFSLVGHRPQTVQKMALGADAEGKLVALRQESLNPTSRLDEFVEPTTRATRILYACPNLHTSQRLVQLDIPTPTFTRAPGEASGSFGVESALDELAWALKLDPVELRLRNHADRDPENDRPWGSKSLRECYRAGAERFGWSKRPDRVRATRDG